MSSVLQALALILCGVGFVWFVGSGFQKEYIASAIFFLGICVVLSAIYIGNKYAEIKK